MLIEKCKDKREVTLKLIEIFRNKIKEYLLQKDIIRVAFATGETYSDFLLCLSQMDLPFERMELFLVDEYAGVDYTDSRSCTFDLCRDLEIVDQFHEKHFFNAQEYDKQINDYNEMLNNEPLDIIFLGVGADGHFAFCSNIEDTIREEPYSLISFNDNDISKQVEYGWFPNKEAVPRKGITITSFGVLKSKTVVLAGYGSKKQKILQAIVKGDITDAIPVSILVKRNNIILVMD